ncbi:MAG: hypothetical protein ABIJ96_08750 [Elusimicrobiota bacterium]
MPAGRLRWTLFALLAALTACRASAGPAAADSEPPAPAAADSVAVSTAPAEPPADALPSLTPANSEQTRNLRRAKLLESIGDEEHPLSGLLHPDGYDGPILAGQAIEAYAEGESGKALLLAQAALGAAPGNVARRRLLSALELKTGLRSDPEGILPLPDLVHRELTLAETAFFGERYGAAVQHCRRALLLDEEDALAWERLGSAHFAAGARRSAWKAYRRALELDQTNETLRAFLKKRGWTD